MGHRSAGRANGKNHSYADVEGPMGFLLFPNNFEMINFLTPKWLKMGPKIAQNGLMSSI
jgi:hypothetical protein